MHWVVEVMATFYILNIALNNWYTYECPGTHLARDGLTSSIFRVQTEDLSITLRVVFWGFQGEADHWRTMAHVHGPPHFSRPWECGWMAACA
jgi:hypothetical protein